VNCSCHVVILKVLLNEINRERKVQYLRVECHRALRDVNSIGMPELLVASIVIFIS
jgi:hypothetical protein